MAPKKKVTQSSGVSRCTLCSITFLNILIACYTAYLYFTARNKLEEASHESNKSKAILTIARKSDGKIETTTLASAAVSGVQSKLSLRSNVVNEVDPGNIKCDDPVWCSVEMPTKSNFRFFSPPDDPIRWKLAQAQAAAGEQVLLKRIINAFPNPYDFLDGDRQFRRIHSLVDVFVDNQGGLEYLLPPAKNNVLWRRRRLLSSGTMTAKTSGSTPDEEVEEVQQGRSPDSELEKEEKPKDKYGELDGKRVVPLPYNYRAADRAPVVMMGYMGFAKDTNSYFRGQLINGKYIDRLKWMESINSLRNKINTPYIAMCIGNENWGLLSTNFPNRTAGWGKCCTDKTLYDFLDDKNLLMLIVNQHTNLSHPKIVVLPRGLPLQWDHTERLAWDSQRYIIKNVKKETLLFASASNWGQRPQQIRCISDKFKPGDFEGHSDTPKSEMRKTKSDRRRYYQKLGSTKFGVNLPGLGYDCFRLWELMSMGTIVVMERSVGLDRTVWKLPVLLVDDLYDINPELLRTAYVEALYHADEFEFQRLTQSFWFSAISNVSYTKSTQTLLDYFPIEAEDTGFTRPRVPYPCGKTGTCGKGTKRIPKNSC